LIPRFPILAPRNQLIDELDDLDPLPFMDILNPVTIICALIPRGGGSHESGPAHLFSYVEALGVSVRTANQMKDYFLGTDSLWKLHLYREGSFLSETQLLEWE
jgi:hypothetical protein